VGGPWWVAAGGEEGVGGGAVADRVFVGVAVLEVADLVVDVGAVVAAGEVRAGEDPGGAVELVLDLEEDRLLAGVGFVGDPTIDEEEREGLGAVALAGVGEAALEPDPIGDFEAAGDRVGVEGDRLGLGCDGDAAPGDHGASFALALAFGGGVGLFGGQLFVGVGVDEYAAVLAPAEVRGDFGGLAGEEDGEADGGGEDLLGGGFGVGGVVVVVFGVAAGGEVVGGVEVFFGGLGEQLGGGDEAGEVGARGGEAEQLLAGGVVGADELGAERVDEVVTDGHGAGASVGSNTCTWILGAAANACSMSGRTSLQSSPPRPQPRGGMAIDVILRAFTSATRARSPDSMSSRLLTPRQCRFVGKFTMNRGLVSCPVVKTNILPGTTSPRAQAAA
jgi:hypothetical protein